MVDLDDSPDAWLALTDAARQLGVSKDALRRRIRSGQLAARKIDSPRGPAWQVRAADLATVAPPATVAATVEPPPATVAPPRSAMVPAAELVGLVERQQQLILELSGRVGWLQAELQQRDERIKALEAPQAEPPAAEPERRPWWRRIF